MTRIDSAAQLAALIRQQIATARGAAPLQGRATQTGTARSAGQPSAQAGEARQAGKTEQTAQTRADVQATIAQRVAAIDPDDPERPRKAFRVFLEAVLLSELGQHLANDPAFYQLVSDVQQQMQADPRLAAAIDRASAALLGQSPKG